jgi:peptidoglycan hydrolase-like protein with peptidoglycan-binding domain
VRALQRKLAQLGFDVCADGEFGPKTERVVKELQDLFGHLRDGVVGDRVQRLIDRELARGWNVTLPNAQELAMRAQAREPGTDGGSPVGGHESPRAPSVPDARHTAAPTARDRR